MDWKRIIGIGGLIIVYLGAGISFAISGGDLAIPGTIVGFGGAFCIWKIDRAFHRKYQETLEKIRQSSPCLGG